MTTIVQTNAAYKGPKSLGDMDAVTRTAAELFDAYETRVQADGGTIQDDAATLAAITAALDGGYFYGVGFAVSPRWGIKSSGGNITQMYGLRGPDPAITGTVGLDTTSETYETAVFDHNDDALVFADVVPARHGRQAAAMYEPGKATGLSEGGRFEFSSGGVVYNYDRMRGRLREDAAIILASNPEFSFDLGESPAWFTDLAVETVTLGKDGEWRKQAIGFTPYLAMAAEIKYRRLGSATVSMAEIWWLNDCTMGEAATLAADITQRYG